MARGTRPGATPPHTPTNLSGGNNDVRVALTGAGARPVRWQPGRPRLAGRLGCAEVTWGVKHSEADVRRAASARENNEAGHSCGNPEEAGSPVEGCEVYAGQPHGGISGAAKLGGSGDFDYTIGPC